MFQWTFLDNEFIPASGASIHMSDLSILRGYAVFDFLRFREFIPLHAEEHIERLKNSAGALGLDAGRSTSEIKTLITELIRKNGIPHGGIRMTLTGGSSADGYLPGKPLLVITQHKFNDVSTEQFNKGIRLISHEYQRQLPHIKSTDYLMGIQLQPEITKQNADDVLYHYNGIITECPRANIFIVNSSRQIITPSGRILHGITRKKIMDMAAEHYSVVERDISLEEVYTAEEIFITSTTKLVLPVAAVDGRAAGNLEFPVSSHLRRLYQLKYSIHPGE
jgi:branched-chain amino acid aminotransferase